MVQVWTAEGNPLLSGKRQKEISSVFSKNSKFRQPFSISLPFSLYMALVANQLLTCLNIKNRSLYA